MDEFNLASRFAKDEDEEPRRGRGKLKRFRPGKTGVGMEKPADLDVPEDEKDMPEEDLDIPKKKPFPDEEPDMEEDDAFRDLVDRMEGESASAGRASARRAKLKGRRPMPRKEDEDEE